ncbi:hypothetical protein NAEGRDRAFT_68477 [Naegleria gruberi]|uniref:Uncharacterized protein n=1 Tax=Naegleria gruberi TaxID=5762 RepID=D2VHX4_NAEGR|nr:uncharacterized protein NAEGRDRAFT_68477 [Naegleria gruberi]EFC43750.1 hypothetical protein NAEGRDRAFT_68477 [Naegleria gruberi]|eukprot:XP_002676494.1 hypothetical protein NAEGRDRAFT_68477 [Naegleria gruberi strain NEG-M]
MSFSRKANNSPSISDGSYNFSKSNASSSIVGTSFISTRTQKVHGVEITSELVWKSWEIGGDYLKKIVVKNVGTEVVEVKYELPKSKTFFMAFPEPAKISPGVSISFEVKFRPIEKKNYTDSVKLTVLKKGEFSVNLMALLPRVCLDIPSYLELAIGETITINTFFAPKEASSYVSTGICKLSNGDSLQMQIQGVGKIPHIVASETTASFGKCPIDVTARKTITVKNTSLVPASYTIERVENDYIEDIFTFEPQSQIILPGTTQQITITYNPTTIDSFDCNNYLISTPGGNSVKLACSGFGVGPELVISPMSINFGDIPQGKEVKRLLTLENKSNMDAEYNIKVDAEGCFKFDKTTGVVSARQTRQITITFFPEKPINYYRRVFVVVKNQGITFIDLLGTSFTSSRRPPPFSIKEVYAYKERIYKGFPSYSPTELETFIELSESGKTDSLSQEEKVNLSNLTQLLSNQTSTTDAIRENIEMTLREYFSNISDYNNPVSINYNSVSFGSCSRFRMAEYKTVTLANRTNGKITCDVHIPTCDGNPSPFVVFPETIDIQPMSTFSFKIGFRPSYDNQFYGSEIEFVCYFKTNRSFRLVNSQTFVPPWSLPLRVFGNTFNNTAAFIPRYTLQPPTTVTFPSCLTGDTTYRSYTIYNENDIPMPFEFILTERQRKHFMCIPQSGMVQKKSFQIVVFKFTPDEPGTFQESVNCLFNDSPNHTVNIPLFGMSFMPTLNFGKDSKVFFKPTHIGTTSTKEITIFNPSRIPISYEWDVPKEFVSTFVVSKKTGVLNGNETQKITWTFCPPDEKGFTIKVPCIISSVAEVNKEPVRSRVFLTLLGEGTSAGITMEPANIDFGNVLVDDQCVKIITLFNSSECDLPYELIVNEESEQEETEALSDTSLNIESPKGKVPARSHKQIRITYCPHNRRVDKFIVYCRLSQELTTMEQMIDLPKCEMIGIGAYPQIGITDVKSEIYSKSDMWHQFSINAINNELRKISNSEDVESNITNFNTSIQELNRFYCDFGSRPIDSDDSVVFVTLENIGKVKAQFSLTTTFDTIVNVEKWAHDQVARTDEELKALSIYVNKLFEIQPNKGTLEPGEKALIAFIYRHKIAEIHELPVLVQVRNGRCFTLHMTGQTLARNQQHLQFASMEHEFEEQEIGAEDHPIQYVKVANPTDQDIEINIDEFPFKQLSVENYDFDVLTLENKKSIVPANHFIYLRFVFKPIEVKTYELNMQIHMIGSDLVYNMTLKGKGVDGRSNTPLSIEEEEEEEPSEDIIVNYLPTSLQPIQQVQTPNQIVHFSSEVLDFETCPCLSVNRRLITVTNLSQDSITFDWNSTIPLDDQQLSSVMVIEPKTCTLAPQEFKVCKVTLNVGAVPQLLDCDIYCEITNISRRERKDQRKKKYEETLIRTVKSLDDDVSDVMSDKSILSIKEHFANSSNRLNKGRIIPKAISKSTTKRESVISKSTISRDNHLTMAAYSTNIPRYLPVSKTVAKPKALERPPSPTYDKFGLQPMTKTKLLISVKAVTVSMENYKYSPSTRNQWETHYIPQLSNNNYEIENRSNNAKNISVSSSIDKGIFTDILAGMLQEIINDTETEQEILKQQDEESSLFYCEFAETPRSSRPASGIYSLRSSMQKSRESSSQLSKANSSLQMTNNNTSNSSTSSRASSRMSTSLSTSAIKQKTNKGEVLSSPEFQQTLEWILDESLFKIVSEISSSSLK